VELNDKFQHIPGTEEIIEADTVCIAVGLSPLTELACLGGCEFTFIPTLGGHVPKHDENTETTVSDLYVAGDIAGVEEASTAMEEGRLAGIAVAESLNLYPKAHAASLKEEVWNRLNALRTDPFGEKRFEAKKELLTISKGEGVGI